MRAAKFFLPTASDKATETFIQSLRAFRLASDRILDKWNTEEWLILALTLFFESAILKNRRLEGTENRGTEDSESLTPWAGGQANLALESCQLVSD